MAAHLYAPTMESAEVPDSKSALGVRSLQALAKERRRRRCCPQVIRELGRSYDLILEIEPAMTRSSTAFASTAAAYRHSCSQHSAPRSSRHRRCAGSIAATEDRTVELKRNAVIIDQNMQMNSGAFVKLCMLMIRLINCTQGRRSAVSERAL